MKSKDGRKINRDALAHFRILAIKLVRSGVSPEAVAKTLGFNRVTIYRWIARFAVEGVKGLKRRKAPGKTQLLSYTQMRSLYYMVIDSTPEQIKMPFALWTLESIQICIKKRFNVDVSKATMSRIMARLGLSFQKPVQRAYEQDGALVKTWLKTEYPKIKKLAKQEKAEIYFEDESGIRSEASVGKTWGKIGKTPIVKRTGKRYGLNIVSAISPAGELRFMFTKGKFGSDEFLIFLKRLISTTNRKVFVIADGHPAHKSKIVQKFLEENENQIRLFFLPPYSPELNPDELVWNTLKGNIGRSLIKNQKDLEAKVISFMRSLQKTPEKVAAFFREKHVNYILNM